ncbi:MAG: hypothetical protein ACM3JG_19830 [Thiohalocapsa sp.]
MQALKVLVVIMGLMILAGLTLLGAVVASRMTHRPVAPGRAPAATAATQSFAAAPIELPAGAHIDSIKTVADRLVVDIVLPGGDRQLIVIDPASGRRLGIIPLHVAH